MRNLLTCGITAGLVTCSVLAPGVRAQSVDALMNKLVEKGILTVKEANELRDEVDKNYTQAYAAKSGMPEWVTALKFNGDFRGRFEGFYAQNDEFEDRNRWRYRLRFGVTATLFENFEVGLRLGSGDIDAYPASGIDPISNNQTLQNNGSKKGIFLDLAYMKWTPLNNGFGTSSLAFGKVENPFAVSDMVFDFDYTPEGFSSQTSFNLSDKQVAKLNAGAFILDEIGASTQDPYLFGAQVLLDSAWSKKFSTSAGLGAFTITSPEKLANTSVPNINVGNTRDQNGALIYDYNTLSADVSATYLLDRAAFYNGAFPVKVLASYIVNPGAPSSADNDGYAVGVSFGKAGKARTWEVDYTYKLLGANAWWEELVDSDFGAYWKSTPANSGKSSADYYNGTNVKGHIVRVAYSPFDFLTLSAKWFHTDLASSAGLSNPLASGPSTADRIQVDAMLKF